jgi:hypothetical protein
LFYEFVMHGSAFLVHRFCVKPLYGDLTEEGIRAGRLANPKLNSFAPVILPWVGAVYTAHMNVSVAALLGYLKGPKPDIFFEFGPYFCVVALAASCAIQLNAINNGLKTGACAVAPPLTPLQLDIIRLIALLTPSLPPSFLLRSENAKTGSERS